MAATIYEGCGRCLRLEHRDELKPAGGRTYGGRPVCRICRDEAERARAAAAERVRRIDAGELSAEVSGSSA